MSKKKSPKIRFWGVNHPSLVILSYINVYDVLSLARCSSVFVLSQFLEQLPLLAQWDRHSYRFKKKVQPYILHKYIGVLVSCYSLRDSAMCIKVDKYVHTDSLLYYIFEFLTHYLRLPSAAAWPTRRSDLTRKMAHNEAKMHICLKCMYVWVCCCPYLSSSMPPTQDSLRDRVRVSSKLLNYGCKVSSV